MTAAADAGDRRIGAETNLVTPVEASALTTSPGILAFWKTASPLRRARAQKNLSAAAIPSSPA